MAVSCVVAPACAAGRSSACCGAGAGIAAALLVRVGVPPQHQFLDDKEQRESRDQREPDAVRAAGACALDRFGQQRQQRCPSSAPVAKLMKCGRMRVARRRTHRNTTANAGASDAAERGEQHDREQQRHGPSAVEPDERRHAAALAVAAVGEARRIGESAHEAAPVHGAGRDTESERPTRSPQRHSRPASLRLAGSALLERLALKVL